MKMIQRIPYFLISLLVVNSAEKAFGMVVKDFYTNQIVRENVGIMVHDSKSTVTRRGSDLLLENNHGTFIIEGVGLSTWIYPDQVVAIDKNGTIVGQATIKNNNTFEAEMNCLTEAIKRKIEDYHGMIAQNRSILVRKSAGYVMGAALICCVFVWICNKYHKISKKTDEQSSRSMDFKDENDKKNGVLADQSLGS